MHDREPIDFFVSYTSVDRSSAEWIARQLEGAGYRVLIDVRSFRPGQNIVLRMHEGAIRAKRMIAVLSPAYFESAFAAAEWTAMLADDPTNTPGKVVPVRVCDFTPPGLFGPLMYIDLVRKPKADARRELLAGVRAEPVVLTGAPRFSGGREAKRRELPAGELPAGHSWRVRRSSRRMGAERRRPALAGAGGLHPTTTADRDESCRPQGEIPSARARVQDVAAVAEDRAPATERFGAHLAENTRILGWQHPATLGSRREMARRVGLAGDAAGAARLFESLISAYERTGVHGPEQSGPLAARRQLAWWTWKAGNREKAGELYEALLRYYTKVLDDPEHRYIRWCRSCLESLNAVTYA
jgi:TIR domain